MKTHIGSVCLIGAGPGNPGLITVRGLELLRRADVIVHDALVDAALLSQARRKAEQIDVGKRAGRHKLSQAKINALLLDRARQGKQVARLKGGDPYLFGRGAEEATFLGQHGVKCEVVPGITAGIAAPAAAGISVTHREHASTVTFITGHEDPTKAACSVDYTALATLVGAGGTVCVYMGAARLAKWTTKLTRHGLAPHTPVAIIQWGTLPTQRSIRTTLAKADADFRTAAMGAPAIMVVGSVAAIEESALDWFTQRPLFGRRVVITRSRHQASELSRCLQELGAHVLEAPTIDVVPREDLRDVNRAVERIDAYDWLILTSVNGVSALADRLDDLGLDARHLSTVRIAVIGRTTARALHCQLGIRADLVPHRFVAESLAEELIAEQDLATKKILLLRADIARLALPKMLADAGAQVTEMEIYHCRPAEALPEPVWEALREARVDWITFTSSSTATNMVKLLGCERQVLSTVNIASIGPITTRAIRQLGFEPAVEARQSDIDGLVAAIVATQAT